MNQLTIFDVIEQFNENLANWTSVGGSYEKCTILAYIPRDALAPTEAGYPSNPEQNRV